MNHIALITQMDPEMNVLVQLGKMGIERDTVSEEAMNRILRDAKAMIDTGFDFVDQAQQKELEKTIRLHMHQNPA